MNAGFSTLKWLKAQLLAEALRDMTEYDAAITAIGQGVAKAMETFCNREFLRTEAATAQFSADRTGYVLPRYPVEDVTGIDLQFTFADGWQAQSLSLVQQVNYESGLVQFGGVLGSYLDLVRLTYTGGYFWNTNEMATDATPAGAAELPADILLAWSQQCSAAWDKRDKLGLSVAREGDTAQKLPTLELIPSAKEALMGHRRYQLT